VRARIVARSLTCCALAAGFGLPGCVSSGKYDDLERRNTSLQQEFDQLAEYNAALEERLEDLNVANEELAAELVASEAQAAELHNTYVSLVSELEDEVATGQVTIDQLASGIRVNLAEDILFPSGSAEVDEGGAAVLARVAGRISDGSYTVMVDGHTDNVPISSRLKSRYPTNWELAGARAAAVVRLLQENGVEGTRLAAVSKGPFEPVAPNDTAEGRARNRRIGIRLLPVTAEGELATLPSDTP
jgi:chemotaxis protein MotB